MSDTLTKAITDFLEKKVRPWGNREYQTALSFFEQSGSKETRTFGLKMQAELSVWLEKPMIGQGSHELANALHRAIDDSIAAYPRPKEKMVRVFEAFCSYLLETYGLEVSVNWEDYEVFGKDRQIQILKLSTEEKSISEMAEKLQVSERQIRKDIDTMLEKGCTFSYKKVKIAGMERDNGRISFESTPHPILLTGNLLQVISLLESLRNYEQISQSKIPNSTAQQIWQQLSEYARDTIKKRIRDGVFDSDAAWYEQLDEPRAQLESSGFQTERAMTQNNDPDRLTHYFKLSKCIEIKFNDELNEEHTLSEVWIREIKGDFLTVEDLATRQEKKIPIRQIVSCLPVQP